jgi:hypothetical protein
MSMTIMCLSRLLLQLSTIRKDNNRCAIDCNTIVASHALIMILPVVDV